MADKQKDQSYWSGTLRLLRNVLIVWAFTGFGASIIFARFLNSVKLGGYPLGFWFAQQGSIYIFIALIFIYGHLMRKIDRKHNVHEE